MQRRSRSPLEFLVPITWAGVVAAAVWVPNHPWLNYGWLRFATAFTAGMVIMWTCRRSRRVARYSARLVFVAGQAFCPHMRRTMVVSARLGGLAALVATLVIGAYLADRASGDARRVPPEARGPLPSHTSDSSPVAFVEGWWHTARPKHSASPPRERGGNARTKPRTANAPQTPLKLAVTHRSVLPRRISSTLLESNPGPRLSSLITIRK